MYEKFQYCSSPSRLSDAIFTRLECLKTLGLCICIRNHEGAFKPSQCCERRYLDTARARAHTYSDRSVHHHRADGEHQQGDGESNAGVLCMTVGGAEEGIITFHQASSLRASGGKSSS